MQEDKILLVSLLMAEMGVHSVAYAFPQVQIITTAVDKKVNDLFHIIPGIGVYETGCEVQCRNFIVICVNSFVPHLCRKLWRSILWY